MQSVVMAFGSLALCAACQTPVSPATDDGGARRDARADVGTDAVAIDSGIHPGACAFDATTDLFELDTDMRASVQRVALAGGPTSFGVAYSRLDASGGENVVFVEIDSGVGAPHAAMSLTTGAFVSSAPTVARTASGWMVAWLGNRDGNVEVYALGSGSDGRFVSAPVRVTTTPTIDERSPALAANGTTSAIAWAEPGATTTTVVRAIGDSGAPSGVAARLTPSGLSMVPAAFTSTGSGWLVGWGDPSGDAMVQPLAADGTAVGTPQAITGNHDADGRIDAVDSSGGGAVAYGVLTASTRHDVHAHLVDAAGVPRLVEHVLTIGLDRGTDASITEIGGGYVVAYRQDATPPVLRVLFFDSLLAPIGRGDLTEVAATGGPVTVRIAADGNVLLTWSDIVGTTTRVRAARLRCQ